VEFKTKKNVKRKFHNFYSNDLTLLENLFGKNNSFWKKIWNE